MKSNDKCFAKRLSQMLLAGFAATSTLVAGADYNWLSEVEEKADGIVWRYVANNGESLVVGCRGVVYVYAFAMNSVLDELATGYEDFENDCFMSAIPPDTSGAISIPSTLGGKPVTTIGEYAFCTSTNLTEIEIPASVRHIAAGAFRGCRNLKSISVASGNTAYKVVNGLLMTADGKRVVAAPRQLENVSIPAGVKYIDDFAFFGCEKIVSARIPEGVIGIGMKAFLGCKSLAQIMLPASFAEFGTMSQWYGEWEESYDDEYYDDGDDYYYVDNMIWKGDEWSEGWWSEGPEGDYDYEGLEWGHYNGAFGGCGALKSISVADANPYYTSRDGVLFTKDGCVIISCPGGIAEFDVAFQVKAIGPLAFYGSEALRSVSIADSVKYIAGEAFAGCTSLTNVDFKTRSAGNSLVFYGYNQFAHCTSLERIELPSEIMYPYSNWNLHKICFDANLPYAMLRNCPKLKYVGLPSNLVGIDYFAFWECSGLESISIPAGVDGFGESAFAGCVRLRTVVFEGKAPSADLREYLADRFGFERDSIEEELSFTFDRTPWLASFTPFSLQIENSVLVGFTGCCPEVLTIPAGVTEIGDSAFDYDENVSVLGLKRVVLPVGLKRVGKWAFFWAGLESLVIPEGVTSLGEGAFLSCTNMTSLTLPESLTELSPSAFRNCGSLREIVIPKGIIELGERALAYCVGLESICFEGNAPKCGENVFLGMNPDCVVYVQKGSTGWNVAIPGVWNGLRIEYASETASENALELYGMVNGVVPSLASVYDGCLYSETTGAIAGTIQVKVGKTGKDGKAAVKATVVVGATKKSLKGADKGKAAIAADGPTSIRLVGGEACEVTLGAEGLSGTYGPYLIDGARNFFSSKDKGEAGVANDLLAKWLGPVNVAWEDGGSASVSIAKKGKVRVAVTLADGTKATANGQLLVGDEWLCVPVVVTKKTNLAFTLWLPHSGGAAVVEGLPDDVVAGKPGTLKAGAKFHIDAEEFSARWGQRALPYLPDGVPVSQNGTKWMLPKAGKVAYQRGGTDVDSAKLGENPSALKLTYKAKDGSFKGAFKVYADNGGRLKATSVNVSGVVVEGVGYGSATVKNAGAVPIGIE